MREFHLRFCLHQKGWYNGLIDLLGDEGKESTIPNTGGAYVIGTAGTMLIYPWGSSPIFYIGKAKDLRARLIGHRTSMLKALEDSDQYWWPRHQYGAAFGAHVAWYSIKGREEPQNIEATLVEAFYDAFGAIPCANATWPNRIRPQRESENE